MTAERIAELRTKAQAVIGGESNIGEMYDALGASDLLELLTAAEANAALVHEVRRLREALAEEEKYAGELRDEIDAARGDPPPDFGTWD